MALDAIPPTSMLCGGANPLFVALEVIDAGVPVIAEDAEAPDAHEDVDVAVAVVVAHCQVEGPGGQRNCLRFR